MRIRPLTSADRDALCAVIAANASELYRAASLLGSVYAAPYAVFAPEAGVVAEAGDLVVGYVVGAWDTRAFEARLERDWWPALRLAHPAPTGPAADFTPDERRRHQIHHPKRAPDAVAASHPAHLHMHVLPRFQRRGLGAELCAAWLNTAARAGDRRAHVGVNAANARGLAFWRRMGFRDLADDGATAWLGVDPT